MKDAYVGIDVACAKGKRLPIAVCTNEQGRMEIVPLRTDFESPPKGMGNAAALGEPERERFASEVVQWLRKLEQTFDLKIRRVAIDAPSWYCTTADGRRACERALGAIGISCFATPRETDFHRIVRECHEYLDAGGPRSRMPNANRIWMLVGFSLFRTLRTEYECIETYPQAIVHEFCCAEHHKATRSGFQAQLALASKLLGLSIAETNLALERLCYGAPHDRLDALFSAWVASLDASHRKAFGVVPDDVIWVPQVAWRA